MTSKKEPGSVEGLQTDPGSFVLPRVKGSKLRQREESFYLTIMAAIIFG